MTMGDALKEALCEGCVACLVPHLDAPTISAYEENQKERRRWQKILVARRIEKHIGVRPVTFCAEC